MTHFGQSKYENQQTRDERKALKKLETAKVKISGCEKGQVCIERLQCPHQSTHDQRVQELESKAESYALKARVIEENLELVDTAISGVNTLLAQGIALRAPTTGSVWLFGLFAMTAIRDFME